MAVKTIFSVKNSTYDQETGNVTYETTSKKKIVRENGDIRVLDNKPGPIIWNNKAFHCLVDCLNGNEVKALIKLLLDIDSEGRICYRDKNRRRVVKTEDKLRKVTGLGKNAWYQFKKKMAQNQVYVHNVTKDDKGKEISSCYLLSPVYVVFSTRWLSVDLVRNFGEELKPYLSCAKRCLVDESLENGTDILKNRKLENRKRILKAKTIPSEEEIMSEIIKLQESKGSEIMTMENALKEIESHEFNEKDEIFKEYVLNGKVEMEQKDIADTWYFVIVEGAKKLYRGTDDDNPNINVYFTPNKIQRGFCRTKEKVVEYNNCYIDVDLGKGADGQYLSLEEVNQRKQQLLDKIINKLPMYTAIVETRNGFHVYWSLEKDTKRESWEETELFIANTVSVSDPQVKDASRVLRLPLTVHKKDSTDPFVVMVKDANKKRYACDELLKAFEQSADVIKEACDEFLSLYPEVKVSERKSTTKNRKDIPKEDIPRIREIMNLVCNPFRNAKFPKTKTMSKEEFFDFVHHQDLSEFLGIKGCTNFRCVFPDHIDNHPSATIFPPSKENGNKYVYLCSCTGKAFDIFDVVQEIAKCNYKTAAQYLNHYFNITVKY